MRGTLSHARVDDSRSTCLHEKPQKTRRAAIGHGISSHRFYLFVFVLRSYLWSAPLGLSQVGLLLPKWGALHGAFLGRLVGHGLRLERVGRAKLAGALTEATASAESVGTKTVVTAWVALGGAHRRAPRVHGCFEARGMTSSVHVCSSSLHNAHANFVLCVTWSDPSHTHAFFPFRKCLCVSIHLVYCCRPEHRDRGSPICIILRFHFVSALIVAFCFFLCLHPLCRCCLDHIKRKTSETCAGEPRDSIRV